MALKKQVPKSLYFKDPKTKEQVEQAYADAISKIWSEFDTDGNGYLSRNETKAFVRRAIQDVFGVSAPEVSEEDFETCFKEIDKDGNGWIARDEMKHFLKKAATN